jgi:hypothetical protein
MKMKVLSQLRTQVGARFWCPFHSTHWGLAKECFWDYYFERIEKQFEASDFELKAGGTPDAIQQTGEIAVANSPVSQPSIQSRQPFSRSRIVKQNINKRQGSVQ